MNIRIAQITDLHITSPAKFYPELGVNSSETLRTVITELKKHTVDAVLCTGDITDAPSEAAYQSAYQEIAELTAPVYCLPGNHDEPKLGSKVAQSYEGIKWPQQLTLGNWQIIFLSTHQEGVVYGHLGAKELVGLQTALEQTEAEHVLIALHHHPVKMNSLWMDNLMLEDNGPLLSMVDRNSKVKAVLWGHVHQEYDTYRKHIRMLGTPSTCRQFKPLADEYAVDDKPPAFRLLSLKPTGEIETETVYCPLRD